MKGIYSLIIILLISNIGKAQLVKLNPNQNIDTLSIWMDYSNEIESDLQIKLQESVKKAINRFNKEQIGFMVVLDSIPSNTSMKMKMGAINYVDRKDNIIWTGVGVATLGIHAYLASSLGYTFPILLLPSTLSKVEIETSEGLVKNKPKFSKFFVNPFGMYRRIDTQKEKMVKKTEKVLFTFLKNLGKQDKRNNKN